MKTTGFIFVMFTFLSAAYAYIPKFEMIVSRTVGNHGLGIYVVDQSVTLSGADQESVIIQEQWLISGGDSMRLRATGQKSLEGEFDTTFVYDKNRKHYFNESGKRVATGVGSGWPVEAIFYYRESKDILELLARLKIIPASVLQKKPLPVKPEDIRHDSEYFVRLGRSGGTISYAIGNPTPLDNPNSLPGLWIEQDVFNILKFRLDSGWEVVASDYKRHQNSLWLPEERIINWDGYRAQIKVKQVHAYSRYSNLRKRLEAKNLDLKEEPHLKIKVPDNPLVKAFYSQFR